jgi:CRP/FNR family cyclic AMP-dependent transcriptional regulator
VETRSVSSSPATRDELHVPKGTVIFRQGDPGNEMFVIAAGRVRLTLGEAALEKELTVLGPGEFFGELSLLSDAPRTATATTVEDSTLLVIGRDVYAMMMQDDLDIVFRMMNTQGRRLSDANRPIEALVQRLGRIRIVADCLRRFMAANDQWPASVEVSALAKELNLTAPMVDATIADLVQRGIGALQGGRWSVQGREQVEQLADVLCRYAGEPVETAA